MNEPTPVPPPEAPGRAARVEIVISSLLRTGILLSLALVALGVAVMFAHHPEYRTSPEVLSHLKSADYRFPTTPGEVLTRAAAGEGRAIVMAGVFVLFLTPLLRVVTSIVAFALDRDWTFVAITSVVLTALILSLVLGRE
jgi:uncharacterized membrane protein